MSLFKYTKHEHTPRNVNLVHAAELKAAGINQKIAIVLTKTVGTMACAYVFTLLAVAGFPNLLGPNAAQYVQWISQTFIQLTMLSVIMVGQGLLGRKQELQSQEQYDFTVKSYHDIEQIMKHLDTQDLAILDILHRLEAKS